jgi:hypothetical protein
VNGYHALFSLVRIASLIRQVAKKIRLLVDILEPMLLARFLIFFLSTNVGMALSQFSEPSPPERTRGREHRQWIQILKPRKHPLKW